jgi:hypothetical protein
MRPVVLAFLSLALTYLHAASQVIQIDKPIDLLSKPEPGRASMMVIPDVKDFRPHRPFWASDEKREAACYAMLAATRNAPSNRLVNRQVLPDQPLLLPQRPPCLHGPEPFQSEATW